MNHALPTIERRSKVSAEEFARAYLMPRRPVIFTDAVKDWPAARWTPDFFKQRYPDKRVQTDGGEMTMAAFIDAIQAPPEAGSGPFLREQPLDELFPDLVPHVTPTPPYALPNWLRGRYLIGRITNRLTRESRMEVNFCGRRVFPYLHLDDLHVHAFITQLYGEKHVIVYPPDQEPYLYRKPGQRFSEIVDVDHPDLARFPLFAKARAIRITLQPGESVFMPCGWWHTTRVPGASLSTVISIANRSNWNDLVGDVLRELDNHPYLAPLYGIYLRTVGRLRAMRG